MWRSILLSTLLALVLSTAPTHAHAAPDPTRVAGLRLIGMNTNAAATETHFIYELQSGIPAISHVDITMCTAKFLRVDTGFEQQIAVETKPGILRIETPQMPDNGTLYFTVILDSNFNAVETAYTIKAGQQELTGTTFGALCTPTAVVLSGFGATDVPSGIWIDVALAVILLILVLWARKDAKR